MKITQLLAFRIFIILFGVMIIGTVIFTAFSVRWVSDIYIHGIAQSTARASEVFNNAMHYSMLRNDKEQMKKMFGAIRNQPGVEAFRIYNKAGVIVFSTDTLEVEKKVDMKAEACVACH